MKQQLAPESEKTQRMREKLRKFWTEAEERITPEALQEKVDEIHRWIARHAKNRIRLKNKKISLFDENQNTAKIGPRVRAIAQKLRQQLQNKA